MNEYKNEFVSVSFHSGDGMGRDYIAFRDLKDIYNETSGFTKKVRNIKMAWKWIEHLFNSSLKDELTFSDISKTLDEKFNLNTHIYCAID